MKNQVIVTAHPETNEVITQNPNKPEYGTIRVDSVSTSMENGYLNKSRRTAFIGGTMEDLQSLGLKAGQALPGQILRQESTLPFWEGQSPVVYPEGNEKAGEQVLRNGKPYYLNFVYTADVSKASTETVDNSELAHNVEVAVEADAEAGMA